MRLMKKTQAWNVQSHPADGDNDDDDASPDDIDDGDDYGEVKGF